jgi:hypothetical protein
MLNTHTNILSYIYIFFKKYNCIKVWLFGFIKLTWKNQLLKIDGKLFYTM